MDLPAAPADDVLASRARVRLFATLVELRRPSTTAELADLVGRHANTTRAQLRRLEQAGLVECRRVRQARGRPMHAWVVAPDARPAGDPPGAHEQLAGWLARAVSRSAGDLQRIESVGHDVGTELAPVEPHGGVADAMHDALAALGFAPRTEAPEGGRVLHLLQNCPYRHAVTANQPAVCTLHRGITRGLLAKIAPDASLTDFVARDPFEAGCTIEIARSPADP